MEYTPGVRSGEIRAQTMTAASSDDFALLFGIAAIYPLRGTLPPWLAGTHRLRF